MKEVEFTLSHDMHHDDALEALHDLLDHFDGSGDFDEVGWDERENIAYFLNNDLEVEIALENGCLDIYAEIHAHDLHPEEIQQNLEEDICSFFQMDLPRRSQRTQERPRKRRHKEDSIQGARPKRLTEKNKENRSSRSTSRIHAEASQKHVETTSQSPSHPERTLESLGQEKKKGRSMWFFLLLLLAGGGIVFFFFNPYSI